MALETLTFDFNAAFFPLGTDFIAAFEYSSLDSPAGYTTSESLSVAKKAVEDDDDEFEDDFPFHEFSCALRIGHGEEEDGQDNPDPQLRIRTGSLQRKLDRCLRHRWRRGNSG